MHAPFYIERRGGGAEERGYAAVGGSATPTCVACYGIGAPA